MVYTVDISVGLESITGRYPIFDFVGIFEDMRVLKPVHPGRMLLTGGNFDKQNALSNITKGF